VWLASYRVERTKPLGPGLSKGCPVPSRPLRPSRGARGREGRCYTLAHRPGVSSPSTKVGDRARGG
jgi:hypothetical protein